MTKEEQERIEMFRDILVDLNSPLGNVNDWTPKQVLEAFNRDFPSPKPKDTIEECRAELEKHYWSVMDMNPLKQYAYQNGRADGVRDSQVIYNRHFPEKETK